MGLPIAAAAAGLLSPAFTAAYVERRVAGFARTVRSSKSILGQCCHKSCRPLHTVVLDSGKELQQLNGCEEADVLERLSNEFIQIKLLPTANRMTTKSFYTEVDGTKIPIGFNVENLRSAKKYRPLDSDIFICTFPKCGTNWTKRIVQLLIDRESRTGEVADYGLSKCFLEMAGASVISSQPEPRIVTSHLYFKEIPWNPNTKYIYVLRNPKDCCVSYFHHTKRTKVYDYENGTLTDYVTTFLNGETSFGSYFEHFRQWYAQKDRPNVLFLTYENMKQDPVKEIQKIIAFLGLPCPELRDPSSAKFQHVLKESGIDAMKDYVEENYRTAFAGASETGWKARSDYPCDRAPPPPDCFVRKGIVGDWKNEFSFADSKAIEGQMLRACEGFANVQDIWDDKVWRDC
ncbi:sulfotransferase 1C2-like isoform X1 [Varroa jacobsoni]|uniref:sulfotransferase 1C2-like isoform X1 n=1 Tax=Varroa jacobsoni TaxID=62625 RepID=UPI000BF4AEDD|nr:sulfotransferase 1C2-like isoform X1 [Varroa jacobsoni]XP_022704407.1 sulfotransferase 1C2-like isoform X1 [Varroa jacobsoni]XP_022704408.1 sulfotransferase 1C2-like isoform X1 [Varroa jacobsoni]XP_022704409.1 sulfotransferase 1C2-like isoform X1 [Varroa jacobsoni]